MVIRIKGDIPKQLNNLYPKYSFKIRYKNELKQRILDFYDSLLKGSASEILEYAKEYCVIENNQIKILNENFLNKYKEELFLSFNPLWFSNKKIKKEKSTKIEEKKEIEKPNNLFLELDISKSIISFLIKEYCDMYADNSNRYKDILEKQYLKEYYHFEKGQLKIDNIEKDYFLHNLNIKDCFDFNKNIKNNLNQETYENINNILKNFKNNLEILNNNFSNFNFEIQKISTSFLGKMFFEYQGVTIYPKDYKEKRYFIFINKKEEYMILETEDKKEYKIINKNMDISTRIKNEIYFLSKKRKLLIYLINCLEKIQYTKWTKENITTMINNENLNKIMFKEKDLKGEEYVY